MDGEEPKKLAHRRTVDHGNAYSRYLVERTIGGYTGPERIRPEPSFIADYMPPQTARTNPVASLATKFVHTSMNKIKHPVLVVRWTPEGRRLLTASLSGEFTLWNGMSFNFETIMQAHENTIRAMTYSHNHEWLLSGDQDGLVKFWQPNFNNVNIVQAHREVVRDIAFSPNDAKFVTASDDGSLKVWDFNDATEEATLTGHGWDVKCADWHPALGLIASGSKDNLIKLWDPRSGGKALATLHGYKNTIMKTLFQPTGAQRLLASGSRDSTARIFDLRMMKDVLVLRGHTSDVLSLAWHPAHSQLLTTGTHDGTISHFLLDKQLPENTPSLEPVLQIPCAHDYAIWSLEYHPLGHILCSGGNDKMTRFWCRARPGDETAFADRYYSEELKQQYQQAYRRGQGGQQGFQPPPSLPPTARVPASAAPSASEAIPGVAIPGLH